MDLKAPQTPNDKSQPFENAALTDNVEVPCPYMRGVIQDLGLK